MLPSWGTQSVRWRAGLKAALQRDFSRLRKQSDRKLEKLSRDECQALFLAWDNLTKWYRLEVTIQKTEEDLDLAGQQTEHEPATLVTKKARSIPGSVRGPRKRILHLFGTARPHHIFSVSCGNPCTSQTWANWSKSSRGIAGAWNMGGRVREGCFCEALHCLSSIWDWNFHEDSIRSEMGKYWEVSSGGSASGEQDPWALRGLALGLWSGVAVFCCRIVGVVM